MKRWHKYGLKRLGFGYHSGLAKTDPCGYFVSRIVIGPLELVLVRRHPSDYFRLYCGRKEIWVSNGIKYWERKYGITLRGVR